MFFIYVIVIAARRFYTHPAGGRVRSSFFAWPGRSATARLGPGRAGNMFHTSKELYSARPFALPQACGRSFHIDTARLVRDGSAWTGRAEVFVSLLF